MKARKIINGTLAALIMATLGASQAHAVDGKQYGGSMCVRFAGATAVLPKLNGSRILNPEKTVLSLDCPAVHDVTGKGIKSGFVDVIDQNFVNNTANDRNSQVCAELASVSQVGSSTITFRSAGRKCTTGANSVSQRLTFGGLPADSNAHYFYSVSLPPPFNGAQSALISYKIDEDE